MNTTVICLLKNNIIFFVLDTHGNMFRDFAKQRLNKHFQAVLPDKAFVSIYNFSRRLFE